MNGGRSGMARYGTAMVLLVGAIVLGTSCTAPFNIDVGGVEGVKLGDGGPSTARVLQLEQRMHDLVRQSRQEAGLKALAIRFDVCEVARSHSDAMLKGRFFDHEDLAGRDEAERLQRQGIQFDRVDEVIGFVVARDGITMSDLDAIHAKLVSQDSPDTRAIILDPKWTDVGYGVAVSDGDNTVYVTGVFLEYPDRAIGVKSGDISEPPA
ncbi:MAG: CAP domain-containing protein [candidate division WS1 bacterium]|nr:CAP domain-containing protein [candidate division WS1 bacterium]